MKKAKKTLSLKTAILLVLLIFFIGVSISTWYYSIFKVVLVKTFDLEVKVSESHLVGFNVDPTLHYGKVPSIGGIAEKKIMLKNDFDFPVRVRLRAKGEATEFFQLEDNDFILEPGTTRGLNSYMEIPPGTAEGIYVGEAKITYLRV
ncbi:TPA: hypothetical protein HA265_08545 [Candidatus Woesearchaeota archaeon]|nr:hypothetical protein [Candidatus Woesearchaeota archaeon]